VYLWKATSNNIQNDFWYTMEASESEWYVRKLNICVTKYMLFLFYNTKVDISFFSKSTLIWKCSIHSVDQNINMRDKWNTSHIFMCSIGQYVIKFTQKLYVHQGWIVVASPHSIQWSWNDLGRKVQVAFCFLMKLSTVS